MAKLLNGKPTNLKLELIRRNISQVDFADDLKIARSMFNEIANGIRIPSEKNKIRINQLLGRKDKDEYLFLIAEDI